MSINVAVLAVGIAAILAGRPAVAHHAFAAEYDAGKPVKLTGTVTKLEWMNPHAWIYVDVPEADGKVANWGCEMGSPNGLMRLGWTRFSLRPGDVVTIEGSRAKSGLNTASCTAVTNAKTGQQLFSGSGQTPQP